MYSFRTLRARMKPNTTNASETSMESTNSKMVVWLAAGRTKGTFSDTWLKMITAEIATSDPTVKRNFRRLLGASIVLRCSSILYRCASPLSRISALM